LKVEVLAVSVDSVFAHKTWQEQELVKMVEGGIPYPMLSDAVEILNSPVGRNVDELIRQIEAFQCVRESKGTEATPAGWQPGKQTLKPSPDLVCKVCNVWESN